MTTLPQGTVTFAFTDIEGSTALLKQLGERYVDVLADHRRLVRESFTAHGGTEIDSQGDAFFFVFTRASNAVAGAVQAELAHAEHEWPEGAVVRVRIGLHTGEPTVSDAGYVGLDVVRAARLCASCRGGQVLLSSSTRALLGSSLPEGVVIFPLGQRHLKDIDEPEVVYQLEIDGVEPSPEAEVEPVVPAAAGAPAPPEPPAPPSARNFDQRMEDWAESLQSRIEEQVASSLERSLNLLPPRKKR
jgi:class 3 adenylate cyclase